MKKYMLPLVVLLSVLVLAACGAPAPSTTLDLEMSEFIFEPAEVVVPAGQEVTLNVSNAGAVEHEFVIMKLGTTVGADFGDEDEENIYWEVEVLAGDSTTVTFTAPSEPGEYQIVCGIEGHFVAGMVGSMTVVAP